MGFEWLGGLGSGIFNIASQAMTNRQNMAITKQNWARDDNAVQRRAADLAAAGINPLLAAGDAAGNSSPIQMKAPEVGDFGASLISSAQVKLAKEQQAYLQKVGDAKLANETAVASAQALELMSKAQLNGSMIRQAEIDTRVAQERKGFVREPATQLDNILKMLDRVSPEVSQQLLGAVSGMLKRMAEGTSLLGSGGITLFPPKQAKPDPTPPPSRVTKDEVESESSRRAGMSSTQKPSAPNWDDADTY